MTNEETYVTAAFLVFLAIAIGYVVIYSFRMKRLAREVTELERLQRAEASDGSEG